MLNHIFFQQMKVHVQKRNALICVLLCPTSLEESTANVFVPMHAFLDSHLQPSVEKSFETEQGIAVHKR